MNSLQERSLRIFPAGSNGEFNLPTELALVIQRGEGCRLWDSDGKEFLDFSMGWGSVLPGHSHPDIVQAIIVQVLNGSNFAYITENSLLLAEEIHRLSPACEQIRFCASGSEATLYCQRMARAYTQRPQLLKFEGAYHGANDLGILSLFPRDPLPYPQPIADSAGVSPGAMTDVLIAPYNDLETTESILEEYADRVAAVIIEPLQRCTPPQPGFLKGVRDLTRRYGILLIFDEVVTGFRLAYGGAQEYYSVIPDLVAYGKALGGGYPIGAYGGCAEIMDLTREERMGKDTYVWTASSLGGNPISSAAAVAALNIYAADGVYPHLHSLGKYLREGMRRVIRDQNIDGQIIGDGPLAQAVFCAQPAINYRTTKQGDPALGRKVMLGLFSRGVFLNPMGTKLYLSLAHDESICDEFLTRFEESLREALKGHSE